MPYKDPNYSSKYYAANRERMKQTMRDHYKVNAPRYRILWSIRKYNLSLVQYLSMLQVQTDCCALCKQPFSEMKHRYNPRMIDHCHETGKVRGIICQWCNLLLGHAKDNPVRLMQATIYLKER